MRVEREPPDQRVYDVQPAEIGSVARETRVEERLVVAGDPTEKGCDGATAVCTQTTAGIISSCMAALAVAKATPAAAGGIA